LEVSKLDYDRDDGTGRTMFFVGVRRLTGDGCSGFSSTVTLGGTTGAC
jgi:hypothetical protein